MGITIHHKSGPIPERVVDHIIAQLEEAYKREGYVEGCKLQYPLKGWRSKCYDKYDEVPKSGGLGIEWWKRQMVSREKKNMEPFITEYEREAYFERGTEKGERAKRTVEHMKRTFADELKRDLMLPDDFNPTWVKGICLNPDPNSETFCVQFVKDGDKDEWREPEEFTKTQYIPQEGVHIELCDYLADVKRKVEAAGAHFKIGDEAEYCDDEHPTKDRERLVHNVQENRKIIDSIGKMLSGEQYPGHEVTVQQVNPLGTIPEGVEPGERGQTGSLDNWMALRGADLLVTVKPKGIIRFVTAK